MGLPTSFLAELPALLVIAEELHFGRAAARLNISQPRVSQIVRRIEDIVGYKVFLRRPQVRLTSAGECLIIAARSALDDLQNGFTRAADIAAGRGAGVRLGYSPVAMLTHLPELLNSVRGSHPGIPVELTQQDTAFLWDGLLAGQLDIIVSREARVRHGVRNELFVRDSMVAALPTGDPAAMRAKLDIRELRDRHFITIDEAISPQWHHAMTSCCHSAGFDPQFSMQVNDWPTILSLVASGHGVSIVSSTLARVRFPGVQFVPLENEGAGGAFWLSYREKARHPAFEALRSGLVAGARLAA